MKMSRLQLGAVCAVAVLLLWQEAGHKGRADVGSYKMVLTACTILDLSHSTGGIAAALSTLSGTASFVQEYTPMIGLFIFLASVMV